MSRLSSYRSPLAFGLIAFLIAWMLVGYVNAPNYTDAYYHFNAAERLASGYGFTDSYLWTYIGAPQVLPEAGTFPSHLYWMPLTSFLAASGMNISNAPGNFAAAQIPLLLCAVGTGGVGYWLGMRLGGTRRHAWAAGLITLYGGFFSRYWGTTDTFAPFALFGSLCLLMMGLGTKALFIDPSRLRPLLWLFAGIFAALGHLTRPDGLLFILTGALLIGWGMIRHRAWRSGLISLLVFIAAYLLVMTPWFVRNLNTIGTALPLGGANGIWYTGYDDLFRYPPEFGANDFAAGGLSLFLSARWQALVGEQSWLSGNLGTFVAVEGMIILTPLMLVGLWRRRRDGFLAPFWLYALGLHLAMTLVFPFPGYRGGLFHAAIALLPFWATLGIVGLDDTVNWIARYRRRWKPGTAKWFFTVALVLYVVFFSVSIASRGYVPADHGQVPTLYAELVAALPAGSRVMINDPSALYYYTGLGGVAVPNSEPSVIPEIAERYNIQYVVLESAGLPAPMFQAWDEPPDFLTPLPFNQPGARLYAIHAETPAS